MIKRRKLRTVITGIIYTVMREEMLLGLDHCEYMKKYIKTKDQLGFEQIADEYVRHLKEVLNLEFRSSLRDEHSNLIGKFYEMHVAYRYRGIDPLTTSVNYPIQPPAVILEIIKTDESNDDVIEFSVFVLGVVRVINLLSYVKEKKPGIMRIVENLREITRYMVSEHAVSLQAYIAGVPVYRMSSNEGGIREGYSNRFKKYLSDKAFKEFVYNDMLEVNFAPDMIFSPNDEIKYDVPDIEVEDIEAFFGDGTDRIYDYGKDEFRTNVVQIDTKEIMKDILKVMSNEVSDNKKFM